MCQIVKVKAGEIFPIIQNILDAGNKVWITVTGMSMYPFLREEKDCVELVKAGIEAVNRGDIVLIQRVTGEYVLHRVQRKEGNALYIVGDAQSWLEGPVFPRQLLARVECIRRNGHNVSCSQPVWKFLALLWLKLIPARRYLLKLMRCYIKMKRLVKSYGWKSGKT